MGKTREQSQSIDPRLTEAAVRNIARAEKAQQIPFMPNRGLRVAALSPAEMASRTMSNQAASAFGFDQAGFGLPTPETVDGFRGYRTSGMYDDAKQSSVPQRLQDYIDAFFIDPNAAAVQPAPTPENGAVNNPSDYAGAGMYGHDDYNTDGGRTTSGDSGGFLGGPLGGPFSGFDPFGS